VLNSSDSTDGGDVGSDSRTTDVTQKGHPLLTAESANKLMAPIAKEKTIKVEHISNTNDVFRVTTGDGAKYYIKFHTASWYKDAPDTAIIVRREHMTAQLLKQKGVRLGYDSWVDCSRTTVGRSVLITSELVGLPLPSVLQSQKDEREQILGALADYFSLLHSMEFETAGYIEFSGASEIDPTLIPERGEWWNSHPCQKSQNLQGFALRVLKSKRQYLTRALAADIETSFMNIGENLLLEYARPHFVINNYHPFHMHVQKVRGQWQVTGFYDLEAASSGNSTMDLVQNDMQITSLMGSASWRPSFVKRYEGTFGIATYKIILVCYLLLGLSEVPTGVVPNPPWLMSRLPQLLGATRIEQLEWYPSIGAAPG
jgi:aminoglycoside phosphotransferase